MPPSPPVTISTHTSVSGNAWRCSLRSAILVKIRQIPCNTLLLISTRSFQKTAWRRITNTTIYGVLVSTSNLPVPKVSCCSCVVRRHECDFCIAEVVARAQPLLYTSHYPKGVKPLGKGNGT